MHTNNKSSSNSLNKTAQEILKLGHSSSDGVILIVNQRTFSKVQCNGDTIEIDTSNGKIRAEYEEAIEQLVSSGYIISKNDERTSYQLTAKSYKDAGSNAQ